MSTHEAKVRWRRGGANFSYETYPRAHHWEFGGGVALDASAAPEYRGNGVLPNPEEALVVALSSCHMLTFLALAARKRWLVDSYEDDACGFLEKNAEGQLAVTRVILRPRIEFAGEQRPDRAALAQLHELAHKGCFIANSVRTAVEIASADET